MAESYITLPAYGSPRWKEPVANVGALPASGNTDGDVREVLSDHTLRAWSAGGSAWVVTGAGASTVTGPASSTDKAVARFSGTTGIVIQDSVVTVSDTGVVAGASISAAANTITNISDTEIKSGANIAVAKLAALSTSVAVVTTAGGVLTTAATTATELGYVSGVTSALQTQLNAKQATITGAATTVVSSNLATSVAVQTDGSGKLGASSVTTTELGYVSGVTSAIQTQFTAKAAGAASSTDTAIAKFSGTGGKTLQNSGVLIDGSNNVTGAARVEATTLKVAATGAVTASCALEVGGTTGALRLPVLTTTQRTNLTGATGMMVFDSDLNQFYGYIATTGWIPLAGWGA